MLHHLSCFVASILSMTSQRQGDLACTSHLEYCSQHIFIPITATVTIRITSLSKYVYREKDELVRIHLCSWVGSITLSYWTIFFKDGDIAQLVVLCTLICLAMEAWRMWVQVRVKTHEKIIFTSTVFFHI